MNIIFLNNNISILFYILNNFLIILIIIILICIITNKDEHMKNSFFNFEYPKNSPENEALKINDQKMDWKTMNNKYSPYFSKIMGYKPSDTKISKSKYLNNKSSYFLNDVVYQSNKTIEITTLPFMKKHHLKFDYGTNTNTLINNKFSIKQEILDPLLLNIEMNNVNYNLITICFKKSKFTFNGKLVGLELHLVHQKYNSLHFVTFIIPLNLISLNISSYENIENFKNIESFKNTKYIKMINKLPLYTTTNFNENESYSNINTPGYFLNDTVFEEKITSLKGKFNLGVNVNKSNKYSLDKLIPSEVLIPKYECCKDTIGQLFKIELYDLQQLLLENNVYYELSDINQNVYYITNPMDFPENIGLHIRESITFDDIIFKKTDK